MPNTVYIGVDPSFTSTGLCVKYDADCRFAVVRSDVPRRALKAVSLDGSMASPFQVIQYTWDKPDKSATYADKERAKTERIISIAEAVRTVIMNEKRPVVCCMEGVSYNSGGAVADLAGLNYLLRKVFCDCGTEYIIASPCENKRFASGNGTAEKDVMVNLFEGIVPEAAEWKKLVKTDDIADAYFLASLAESRR